MWDRITRSAIAQEQKARVCSEDTMLKFISLGEIELRRYSNIIGSFLGIFLLRAVGVAIRADDVLLREGGGEDGAVAGPFSFEKSSSFSCLGTGSGASSSAHRRTIYHEKIAIFSEIRLISSNSSLSAFNNINLNQPLKFFLTKNLEALHIYNNGSIQLSNDGKLRTNMEIKLHNPSKSSKL